MNRKAPVLHRDLVILDRAINELAPIHFSTLENEILRKVEKRLIFTAYKRRVVCCVEPVTTQSGAYSANVICYTTDKKWRQFKVAVFYIGERGLMPAR